MKDIVKRRKLELDKNNYKIFKVLTYNMILRYTITCDTK